MFPFVEQRPIDGAGAEVGHVGVAFEARDGGVQEGVVLAEDRPVRGEQVLRVTRPDPLQAGDELQTAESFLPVTDQPIRYSICSDLITDSGFSVSLLTIEFFSGI